MRLQQDFLGSVNRIRSRMSEFDARVTELRERWRDATATEFQEQHLDQVGEVLRRLMLSLQAAAELASQCDKALRDEEY
jgi:uncharacterized protein YukE